jgi:hypothetical protein
MKMHALFLTAGSLLVISAFRLMTNTESPMDLDEAMAKGIVEVKADSNDFSKKSLRLTIINLGKENLNLRIPSGMTFLPEDKGDQTLLQVQEQMLALKSKASGTVRADGYCSEMHDGVAPATRRFALQKNKQARIDSLLLVIKALGIKDKYVIQDAIWCITDNNAVSNIYGDDNPAVDSLKNYLCKVTGQNKVWYSTRRESTVTAERRISHAAMEVSGLLYFHNNEEVKLYGLVTKENGEPAMKYPQPMVLPPGDIDFKFRLRVNGWAPGKYYIIYKLGSEEILKKEFVI